jgi:bifunctional DNase/RNase
MDVEMKIRGLVMDSSSNPPMPIVILKDLNSDTVLPIWVGLYEANAIALEIEKTTTPRPMTHDLARNLIEGLNASVQKVVVNELRNDTFYAVIWLALRCDCPIFVSEDVLRVAKYAPASTETTPDELRRWLEGLNDEDLGRYKM